MPFDGSGNYVPIAAPDFPAVAGTTIRSSQYNNQINDIAAALSDCLTRSGQSTASADQPMGGKKHLNVAAAALRTQYARAAEAQDGTLTYLTSVAGTDTITAVAPLSLAAYVAGQAFRFISAGANTGPATLNINSIGAVALTKYGTTALEAGDIPAGAAVTVVYDGVRFQLQTVALSPNASTVRKGLVQLATSAEAQDLTDALKALTPATLAAALQGANQSLAVNGYQKLPGGLIVQWGQVAATAATGTTTFPIAFPNNVFIQCATDYDTAGTAVKSLAVLPTLTDFQWAAAQGATATDPGTFAWFAVGN